MLKRRIHKWRLDKNNKEHEMKAMVDLVEQRRLQGRSPLSVVRVGRRDIPLSEVRRYFRRKGIKNLAEKRSVASNSDIVVTDSFPTPSLDSKVENLLSDPAATYEHPYQLSDELSLAFLQPTKLTTNTMQSATFDRPLSMKRHERMVEAVVEQTRNFCAGWFDGPWTSAQTSALNETYSLLSIAARFVQGLRSLRQGSYETAFISFDSGLKAIRSVAAAFSPSTLSLIFDISSIIIELGVKELAQQTLWFVADLSGVFYGLNHPLRTIFHSLLQAPPHKRSELIENALHGVTHVHERMPPGGFWGEFSWVPSSTPFCWQLAEPAAYKPLEDFEPLIRKHSVSPASWQNYEAWLLTYETGIKVLWRTHPLRQIDHLWKTLSLNQFFSNCLLTP